MNGFLPLVEAFLAFALTMLALATAVSAVVGVWMRFFRWRALGLRRSVSLLYDKEIVRRLGSVEKGAQLSPDRDDFIAHMTFGLDLLSGAGKDAESDQRLNELRALRQKPPSNSIIQPLRWLVRRFRRWRSLRFGVDYLTKSQFRSRLDASQVRKQFANRLTAPEWAELRTLFERSFYDIGETATEAFERRARVRTIVVSLALAIGLNIDAFGLLNAYMTDREVRRSVIAQQEAILAQKAPVEDAEQKAKGEPGSETSGFDGTLEQLRERIEKAASIADQYSADVVALGEVKVVLEGINSYVDAIAESKGDLDMALSATRGIANQLTKSFPIGWDGYPNCYYPMLDARCALVYTQAGGPDLQPLTFSTRLSAVARTDSASFIKWCLGILLSGLMVGLGAPFWVQTVNRLLKLKADIQGEESDGRGKAKGDEAGVSGTVGDKDAASHVMSRVNLSGRAVRPTGEMARRSTDDWLAAQKQSTAQIQDV